MRYKGKDQPFSVDIGLNDIIQEVSTRLRVKKDLVKLIANGIWTTAKYHMANGESVRFGHLGTFRLIPTGGYKKRIPNGSIIYVSKRKRPVFIFTERFKEFIRKETSQHETEEMGAGNPIGGWFDKRDPS